MTLTVEEALNLRGKSLLIKYQFDSPEPDASGIQIGRVVGVVVPSPGSDVPLQLLMVDDTHPNSACTEGYQFEIYTDTIVSYSELALYRFDSSSAPSSSPLVQAT